MHTKSLGTIALRFKSDEAFCNFNLAKLSSNTIQYSPQVAQNGPRSYILNFEAACSPEEILRDFKIAYDRAYKPAVSFPKNTMRDFVTETIAQTFINEEDYKASLLSCAKSNKIESTHSTFEAAQNYFQLANFDIQSSAQDNNYVFSDGAVEFIQLFEKSQKQETLKLASYLSTLVSIVTAYVNNLAIRDKDSATKVDPAIWIEAIGKLPLMSSTRTETNSYSTQIKGFEINTFFTNLLTDQFSENPVEGFNTFLTEQGLLIQKATKKIKGHYQLITPSIEVTHYQAGNEVVFVPKIKFFTTYLNSKNASFLGKCLSPKRVKIALEITKAEYLFDYNALKDPEIQKQFEKFISSLPKAPIAEANTYFRGFYC